MQSSFERVLACSHLRVMAFLLAAKNTLQSYLSWVNFYSKDVSSVSGNLHHYCPGHSFHLSIRLNPDMLRTLTQDPTKTQG